MNTRFLPAILAAALVSGACPAQAAKHKVRWVLAHANLDFFEEAAADFKKIVEKGSKGDIEVVIETQTDPEASAEKAVAEGRAEMGHSFTETMGAVDPRYWAFEAPYLMRDYRHMEGVIDGPVGDDLLSGLRPSGMVGLALTYSGGANGVASAARELRTPADLKGLKVGVFGNAVNEAWLRSLGAVPVAIGHRLTDILPMTKQGALDAVVVTPRNFERENLARRYDAMNLLGSTYLVSVTYANAKFFDSLPEAYRDLIMKASRHTARIERAKTIELNESAKRALAAKGVRTVHPTARQKAAFAAALAPAYAGALETLLGKDFLERVRRAPDGEPYAPVSEFASR